jgi:hypothetical protein
LRDGKKWLAALRDLRQEVAMRIQVEAIKAD